MKSWQFLGAMVAAIAGVGYGAKALDGYMTSRAKNDEMAATYDRREAYEKKKAQVIASSEATISSARAKLAAGEIDEAERVLAPLKAYSIPDAEAVYAKIGELRRKDRIETAAKYLKDGAPQAAADELTTLVLDKDPEATALNSKILVALNKGRARDAAIEKAAKKKAGVRIGMNQEDVIASSWGKPQSVNRTQYSFGVHEQWVYGGRNYLYFENGKLTAIQN